MFHDSFFRGGSLEPGLVAETCSPSCPGARPGGFCGVRIEPECLRIDRQGKVRVGLSASPGQWFGFLAGLGETLHFKRNPVAVLGRRGRFPLLDDWSHPELPAARRELCSANLAEHGRLWATLEITDAGPRHGLEVEDLARSVFQRVWLTQASRWDLFEEFVTQHQSPPEQAEIWLSPNHARSARRRATLLARVRTLRAQQAAGSPEVRRLPGGALARLLEEAGRAGLPIRTMVYSPAMVQGAVWIPAAQAAPAGLEPDAAAFFSDGETRLWLSSADLSTAWLWCGPCACCGEVRWSVEVADRSDGMSLALRAGTEAHESAWRDVVRRVLG